jgi:ActR/RegA family two-component response regulator
MKVAQRSRRGKKKVDLLILEDDIFYSNLLAKKFKNFRESPDIKENYKIKIEQFNTPEGCLEKAKSLMDNDQPTIAFVDYYLGNGINGHHIIKLLVEQNEAIKIVMMSQSENVVKKMKNVKNPTFTKVLKHEHTPEICCMMLEQYIQNL